MPGVAGGPTDVHTVPGTYDGYSVYFGCEPTYRGFSVVFVRGDGTVEFPQPAGIPPPLGRGLEAQFWELAATARDIAAVSAIHAVTASNPCLTHGWAIDLDLHDYRGVDDAIRRLGGWLARENLHGEVMLRMVPVPGPGVPE